MAERGKSRVQTTMRLPERIKERLRAQAEVENRSVTNLTIVMIEEGLARRASVKKGAPDGIFK
jgi:predicted DNA-binding protein